MFQTTNQIHTGWWYTYPSEKWWSESQLGWWHSQYDGKNNPNVPNHQPVYDISTYATYSNTSRRYLFGATTYWKKKWLGGTTLWNPVVSNVCSLLQWPTWTGVRRILLSSVAPLFAKEWRNQSVTNKGELGIYGGFPKWGEPLNHPKLDRFNYIYICMYMSYHIISHHIMSHIYIYIEHTVWVSKPMVLDPFQESPWFPRVFIAFWTRWTLKISCYVLGRW